MTARYLAIAAFVMSLFFSASAIADDTDEAVLNDLLNNFLAGASRGDVEVHERFWSDDLVYTSSRGERTTKQAIVEGMRAANATPTDSPSVIYSAEDVSIRLYDDTAIVAFRLVATPQAGSEQPLMNYFNTGTFLKRNDEWRAIAWQATIIPSE